MPIPTADRCREIIGFPPGADGFVGFHQERRQDLPFHCHDDLELNLVVAGRARYEIDGGVIDLASGSLLWLLPRHVHRLAGQGSGFRMWVVVVRRRAQERVLHGLAADGIGPPDLPGPPATRQLPEPIFADLQALLASLHRRAEDRLAVNAGLRYLLAVAWDAWRRAPAAGDDSLHPAVRQAARLLADDPGHAIGGLGGLSRGRLSRLFRAQMGATLLDHRRRLRIERFRALAARQPDRSLLALALDAGFGSYAQFHRDFTRATGSSPRQWTASLPRPHYG